MPFSLDPVATVELLMLLNDNGCPSSSVYPGDNGKVIINFNNSALTAEAREQIIGLIHNHLEAGFGDDSQFEFVNRPEADLDAEELGEGAADTGVDEDTEDEDEVHSPGSSYSVNSTSHAGGSADTILYDALRGIVESNWIE